MALVYSGEGKLSLQEREAPKLQQPRDAIVRVTRSAICTSDLHIKNGAVPRAKQGIVLGHEFVGEIVEAGSSLSHLRLGDRVGRQLHYLLRRVLVLPAGIYQQLRRWRLGAGLPH